MANSKYLETNENGVQWYEVSGTDSGTGWEFNGVEIVGLTDDNRILDCDGCPVTPGDLYEIAIRNTLEA